MSDVAGPIRIDDLADPVLTPMQKMAREAVAKLTIDLSGKSILDEARSQTGLSDFGEDDFRERLGVWLAAVEEDEGLAPVGRIAVRRDIVRYAANPAAVRGPLEASSGDPRGRDPRAHHHRGIAALGDHASAQPHRGRLASALAALLGEPRAGPGSQRVAWRRRRRPPAGPLPRGLCAADRDDAAAAQHARHGAGARPRGDRAPGARLLLLRARVDRHGAPLA